MCLRLGIIGSHTIIIDLSLKFDWWAISRQKGLGGHLESNMATYDVIQHHTIGFLNIIYVGLDTKIRTLGGIEAELSPKIQLRRGHNLSPKWTLHRRGVPKFRKVQ